VSDDILKPLGNGRWLALKRLRIIGIGFGGQPIVVPQTNETMEASPGDEIRVSFGGSVSVTEADPADT
jgi:hypothetical protein